MDIPESLPELLELRTLIRRGGSELRTEVLCEVRNGGETLPVVCVEMGTTRPELPAVAFIGGIHGIERIGTQVVLAYLHTLVERLHWDSSLAQLLEQVRLIFLPIVNPGGMRNQTRSNPAGVDLMRNAPVEAEGRVPLLLGGQRFSRHLDESRLRANGLFMPFTLELGSWLWVKKNPWQLFRLPGIFNPMLPHRKQRILRQHLTFLDFLLRAAVSHARWRPPSDERQWLFESGVAYWFKPPRSAAAGTE